jgi:mono/diheme cytochrome c family protein
MITPVGVLAVLISAAGISGPTAQPNFPLAAARAKSPAEAVYLAKCQYCHTEMGPGTITLARRVGKEHALLATRTDLNAEYVKIIVRRGLNTMPAINRVEVSDAELEQIAAYLSRPAADRELQAH